VKIIEHEKVSEVLDWAESNKNNRELVNSVLDKARKRQGLECKEATLLLVADYTNELLKLAEKIKQDFYGSRVVLFAPLYLSNYCVNGCVYCPFNCGNAKMGRRKLTQDEIRQEVIALQDMGHKRLALEVGEHPEHNTIEYVTESINTIYDVKHKNGSIRRVNVNIAATSVDDYRKLKAANIGTYLLFQETYHEETYRKLHPKTAGLKHDYDYHLTAMDRAIQAEIDDVGIGALFGLYDYRYEFAAMLMHAEHLDKTYGVGPHTISVPRIRGSRAVHGISDDVFIKIVAALRVAVPYTGLIISTREAADCRLEALTAGASQISGGSRTNVGGYSQELSKTTESDGRQFAVSDERTLDEIVLWLLENEQIPSFCTACYRLGRVGDRFMELAKSGKIAARCHPNSLITLQEYLIDYATPATLEHGEQLIGRETSKIEDVKIREFVCEKLSKIKQGERDFRL
jgi:2-iminoacetate synthase